MNQPDGAPSDAERLERSLIRERIARARAEELLESRARELYGAQQQLETQYHALQRRTAEIELLNNLIAFVDAHDSLDDILQFFVNEVCSMCQWPLGHIYLPPTPDQPLLQSTDIWYGNEIPRFAEFCQFTQQLPMPVGAGLPGRVYAQGQSAWVADVTIDNNFPRAQVAAAARIHAGFAVPIRTHTRTIAIAEFFADDISSADHRLLTMVETAAMQLGIALERHLAEQELRRNNAELQTAVHQLQRTQVQLVQSEKMAGLGQLAAGIAHEINNPIGYVMSNLGTLQHYTTIFVTLLRLYHARETAQDPAQQEQLRTQIAEYRADNDLEYCLRDVGDLLSESRQGIDRVREIVQGLKSFARIDEAEIKEADINDGIETTLRIVWNELKYKCIVEKDLTPLPTVRCYPGQLNQVIMNLLLNAAEAIPDKGRVRISTRCIDDQILIAVSDTGQGIAPEHIPELFTPFFTTKPVGKGTGLGLSISYGIIQKHNGTIAVTSDIGKGSTFTIQLPCSGVPHGAI